MQLPVRQETNTSPGTDAHHTHVQAHQHLIVTVADRHTGCQKGLAPIAARRRDKQTRYLLLRLLLRLLLLQQPPALCVFFPHRAIFKELLLPYGYRCLQLINCPVCSLCSMRGGTARRQEHALKETHAAPSMSTTPRRGATGCLQAQLPSDKVLTIASPLSSLKSSLAETALLLQSLMQLRPA